jgi:phosphate transport system protein
MANHLERMGDYATNISRRVHVLQAQGADTFPAPLMLFRMGELICHMMEVVWNGFQDQRKDVMELAWAEDEEVDQLYNALLRELLTAMVDDPQRVSLCTHYLFIAKNIERLGDHATNLGEIVAIMVRGKPLKELRRRPVDDSTLATPHPTKDPYTP